MKIWGAEIEDLSFPLDSIKFIVSGYEYLSLVKSGTQKLTSLIFHVCSKNSTFKDQGETLLFRQMNHDWPKYPIEFEEIRAIVESETQGIFFLSETKIFHKGIFFFEIGEKVRIISLRVGETHNFMWAEGDRLFTWGQVNMPFFSFFAHLSPFNLEISKEQARSIGKKSFPLFNKSKYSI